MLTPTSGAQWREKAREGAMVLLPSGWSAKVRNVPISLLMSGTIEIPNGLMPVITEFINRKDNLSEADLASMLNDHTQEFFAFIDLLCKLAFLEPRIVDNPQADNEIHISDMDDDDKMVVTQLLGMSVQQLKPFCEAYSQAMGDLRASQSVEQTAERVAEPA